MISIKDHISTLFFCHYVVSGFYNTMHSSNHPSLGVHPTLLAVPKFHQLSLSWILPYSFEWISLDSWQDISFWLDNMLRPMEVFLSLISQKSTRVLNGSFHQQSHNEMVTSWTAKSSTKICQTTSWYHLCALSRHEVSKSRHQSQT